ncbi:MAG: hypothetical protein BWY67_00876 [Bacteroidetes bacterium ADurb.Bin397]|jgi:hypothetical protein|nr:MAG: hypothetical protein BWY67_00876 [Bacteroidetes bacterium ADurb.Bin397]
MLKKYALSITGLFLLLIYNYIFWNEKPGINFGIFSTLLAASLAISRPEIIYRINWWFAVVCVLLTGVGVTLFNSGLSIAMHFFSCLVMIVFSWPSNVKSPAIAIFNFFAGAFNQVLSFFLNGIKFISKTKSGRTFLYYFKIAIAPLVIMGIYLLLYSGSSNTFANYFNGFFTTLGELIESFFENVSAPWLVFLLGGMTLIALALKTTPAIRAINYLNEGFDDLFRINKSVKKVSGFRQMIYRPVIPMNAIRKQFKSGVLLLIGVNILLLIFNITDIKENWFGYQVPENFSLKNFVHEATWYLIISMLLSIVILLYYFHGNLNFYKKNKTIKILSYVWIVQNTLLCTSVLLRNWHYISYHGLAYKRIGVLVFLALVIIGLITMYKKIEQKKSAKWLLKINSVACVLLLSGLSLVNWDMVIARYNLNHANRSEIDVDFYLKLGPAVYPLLYENLGVIEEQIKAHHAKPTRWCNTQTIQEFRSRLNTNASRFTEVYPKYTWPSYNTAEATAYNWLTAQDKNLKLSEATK